MTDRLAEHADFPPSSMSMLVQCPGSWKMQRAHPQDPNAEDAAEGTAAHWVKSQYGKLTEAQRQTWPGQGTLAPNGILVTEEMIEGAQMYWDAVGEHDHDEEPVPASELIHPDNWGTPDNWSYKAVPLPGTDIGGGLLRVADYKFGHRYVDVFENWQLINYALLILDSFGINGLQEQHTRVEFTIVQPRSYCPEGPVRKWSCLASDLRAMRNTIRSSILAAQSDTATCWVGTACRDCSARAFCPTLQKSSLAAMEESGRPSPMIMPDDALALEIRLLKRSLDRMKVRLSGLEEVALAKARAGAFIPGFRLDRGKGRIKWNKSVKEIEQLGNLMGVKVTNSVPITPNQAIKAGLPSAVVDAYSEVSLGETKLIEDDGTLARRTFGYKT